VSSSKKLRLDSLKDVKDLYYDPDGDDFRFDIEKAFAIAKRINMFNLIRKTILFKEGKIFELALDELNERLTECKLNKERKVP
jgi:hypothetical protein